MTQFDDFSEFVQGEMPDLNGPDFPDDLTPEFHKPPCTIILGNGETFHVTDIDAWEWQPYGLFATGYFKDPDKEEDVLAPYTSITYIKYDFAELERWLQEQANGTTPGN